IARRAKAAGAVIYWGDETGISNQDQVGRSWAPKGETPVVARTAKRATRSMIAAVSNRGLMRFMLHEGALSADLFLDFLRRLVRPSRGMALALVAGLACGWPAGAVSAARADTINACVGPGGQVRVPGSGGGCKGNETPLSLSTQGVDTVVTDLPVSSVGGGGP